MDDILKSLKTIDKVEKRVPIHESVSLSINANGETSDDVVGMLGKLMNLQGMKPVTPSMMPQTGPALPMVKTIADVGRYADAAGQKYANDVGEEYANEPEEVNFDTEFMIKDLAGGLNRPKKTYPKVSKADNPMQPVSEDLATRLMTEYQNFKSK